jgi:hypothetical protein
LIYVPMVMIARGIWYIYGIVMYRIQHAK